MERKTIYHKDHAPGLYNSRYSFSVGSADRDGVNFHMHTDCTHTTVTVDPSDCRALAAQLIQAAEEAEASRNAKAA